MPQFHANTALQYKEAVPSPDSNFLYRVYEQSEDQLLMAKLNLKLQKQCGEEFYVQCFAGEGIEHMPRSTMLSLADCYAEVFNESWGESWTRETALQEVQNCISCDPAYRSVMTLLFHEERVVGFSWAYIMDTENLTDESAPFSSSNVKRHESVSVARYWLENVGRKGRLVSIRELGVIKEFRQDKTPYLTLPIFEQAKAAECNVAFFRTKISSKAFKWSLGVGFVPLQLFMVDGLLLMKGSVKYAMKLLYGSIDAADRRKSQVEIIGNIKRYLCD